MMTDEQLAVLARHAEQAPPGPWYVAGWEECCELQNAFGEVIAVAELSGLTEHQDRQLMPLLAAAPELLAEVVRLREENATLRAAVDTPVYRAATLREAAEMFLTYWESGTDLLPAWPHLSHEQRAEMLAELDEWMQEGGEPVPDDALEGLG